MIHLAHRRNILGQMQPFLTPTLAQLPIVDNPIAPASDAMTSNGSKGAVLGLSLLYAGLGTASALFSYGVAKESKSKMVRTTGYILAGVASVGVLATLLGGSAVALLSGGKR